MPDAKKMSLSMGEFWESSHISGGHSAYLENMYELYLENPDQLSSEWVVFFDNLEPKGINGNRVSHKQIVDEFKNLSRSANLSGNIPDARQSKVIRLIQSFRNRGHQKANLDPLGIMDRAEIEDLDLEFHGLSKDDLNDEFYTDTLLIGKEKATLKEIIDSLIQDIDTLVSTFADISKSDDIYVKLKKVDSNQCKFWHQDSVDFRLVTTYRGPCTEFVQPEYSRETLENKEDDSKYAQSLSLRDVALFKGQGPDDLVETNGTNKEDGIVHRSPRIEKEKGVWRLLLVLDIPQQGWHY